MSTKDVLDGVVLNEMSDIAKKEEEEDNEEQLSYDLLDENDSDEFESVEISTLNDEDQGRSFLPVESRRKSNQSNKRPSPRLARRRKKLDQRGLEEGGDSEESLTEDIAHLTTDEDHLNVIPVSSTPVDSKPVNPPDESLSSDMLISLLPSQVRLENPIGSIQTSIVTPDSDILPVADEETAEQARRARIDSASADDREFEDEDVHSPAWANHRKHIFIVSVSGKPIYSRYGKEEQLVNIFGIMQALVSIVQDDKDILRCVSTQTHKIVFLNKSPLVFVAVSRSPLSESQLKLQLSYTYYQILSVLTNTQLRQIYDRSPGFDLRYLLQGSEKFIDNILNLTDHDPSYLLSGIRCLAMNVSLRQAITTALLQSRHKDVLFALLIAEDKLIAYIKPKDHHLHPIDIHLIFNLVMASTSFRSAESWTPICLPKFNDSGFLHAYVSYLPNNSPACLLLISTNKEKFFELQQCKEKIVDRLTRHGLLEQITASVEAGTYTIDHLQAPEIRHFLYRSRKSLSVTSPQLPVLYSQEEDRLRLFDHYMSMNQQLHSHMWPTKILYQVESKEALLGWRTGNFDLYIVFDPLLSKPQAITLGNKLIRWINKEEDRLIITSTTTF